jgi:hypothetical protein
MKHLSVMLLEQYALRELSDAEMQRVEEHVKRCSECMDRLEGEAGSVLGLRLMDRSRKMFPAPGTKRDRKAE